jgi:AP2-like factor (ANT lineage)
VRDTSREPLEVRKGRERERERERERGVEREKLKMKSMSNNNNGSNNNWLGFSLSPHMKMEAASDPQHHHQYHHQTQTHAPTADSVSAAVPTSFYLSTSLFNSSGICYGVGENGGFHSPLSVMPLKSDGSLCIMEALTRSQPEGLLPA